MAEVKIESLYIYPIKSCGGISVKQINVTKNGPEYDREWVVVDENNKFVTQRQLGAMAQVKVDIQLNKLVLNHPNQEELGLTLNREEENLEEVEVWSDRVKAFVYPNEVNEWFSQALNKEVKLARLNPEQPRYSDTGYGESKAFAFADGFPFLMISQESLNDLNSKVENPMEMARFRPNIVVAGGPPYFEDSLKRFSMGDLEFEAVKACSRCVVTTLDPETGAKTGREPLTTLSSYKKQDNKVLFGQNLIYHSLGCFFVGDPLTESL